MLISSPESDLRTRERPKIHRVGAGVADYTYRHYDPVTGRWPSRDPLWENGGLNLYGNNNEFISFIDFLGLIPCNSKDDCGEQGAQEATEKTKNKGEGIEYCGSICCKDGKFTRTEAKEGTAGRCDPSQVSPCTEGKEVGVFHSHPGNTDFSYDDYSILPVNGSNYLGRPDGIRRLDKVEKRKDGNVTTEPETYKKGNDGKYHPYPPENNGLRADQGLAPLSNGTVDPYKNFR